MAALPFLVRGDLYTVRVDLAKVVVGSIEGHRLTITLRTKGSDASADTDDSEVLAQGTTVVPASADADAGIGYVNLAAADTDGLDLGEVDVDIQWVIPGSDPLFVRTLFTSRSDSDDPLTIVGDVTRTTA